MAKRTGPTNPILRSLVGALGRKSGERTLIWEDVAEKLALPSRSRVEVNVAEISRNAKDGESVVVPGVVLSAGSIDKKVSVAAWKFSASAKEKIKEAGGKAMTIDQLRKENPKGTNVRVII
jgi:large subunit ribosomal protein L18e